VAGFGGMRDHGDTLEFAPRLPAPITKLRFRLLYRGRCLQVEVDPDGARYELIAGDPLELLHDGEPVTLEVGSPQAFSCPARRAPGPVEPPPGRAPDKHGVGSD
jgi:alpha,alpha-trehalose phosphorylase